MTGATPAGRGVKGSALPASHSLHPISELAAALVASLVCENCAQPIIGRSPRAVFCATCSCERMKRRWQDRWLRIRFDQMLHEQHREERREVSAFERELLAQAQGRGLNKRRAIGAADLERRQRRRRTYQRNYMRKRRWRGKSRSVQCCQCGVKAERIRGRHDATYLCPPCARESKRWSDRETNRRIRGSRPQPYVGAVVGRPRKPIEDEKVARRREQWRAYQRRRRGQVAA